jgi:hypothetical protein
MPSKTMWFAGTKITASRPGGLGLLLGLLLLLVVGSVVVRAAEAVTPTVTLILTIVPALALAAGGVAAAVVLTRHFHGEREARFVQRKLAAELAAELAELPAPTVRVDSLRPELPPVRVECERLSEPERLARGIAALEAATRRRQPAPVDLDKLEHRR